MVHLRGMVHEGWYMVQESKLWYDYIIMVRSGNAAMLFKIFCSDLRSLSKSYTQRIFVPYASKHLVRNG